MLDENQVRMTGSIIASLIWTLLVSTLLFALSGCGGGDDPPGQGQVKLSITDAPLDDAAHHRIAKADRYRLGRDRREDVLEVALLRLEIGRSM